MPLRSAAACLLFGLLTALSAQAQAPSPSPERAPPLDYADAAHWLCWPGRTPDACDVDLDATRVAADGSMSPQPYRPARHPPIDCFYVYPTVSLDRGVLASDAIEPPELRVVQQQFARFGAVCRTFAPVYRQFTLTSVVARQTGRPMPAAVDPTIPYRDVLAAWNYYLAHDNHGRGVVLIGHSQGSGVLAELIASEIDGTPEQARLVSAILMGASLPVPAGADVGGAFKHVPLCHGVGQTGCVIAFASFRETSPPPPNSLFGRPREPMPGMVAACVNPANLEGGWGPLEAYLASGAQQIVAAALTPPPWVQGKTVTTPFVTVPGLLSARCVTGPEFNYLAVRINALPGPRVKDIVGDVVVGGAVRPEWGLHLIDANLTIGNLIDDVRQQTRAWEGAHAGAGR
ncbi:MAG TPA: DUF3089 domain-containing protein [Caulobacteraceae bacterium]|nr:DUF3089 domain-containing protein [Caulobacteraceae bacterium]